jgi:hypothetical protein
MALWDVVTETARAKKQLVYALDQTLTPGFAQCPKGYCVGLAIRWVHHRWRLGDYNYDAASQELHSPDREAVDLQRTYDTALAGNGHLWSSIEKALFQSSLKLHQGRSQETNNGFSSSGLYNILEKGSPGYSDGGNGVYLVGMAGASGSHCMAIANEADGWWRLFDGNYGHFRMKGNAVFSTFLRDFLHNGQSGYVKKYTGGWATIGVLPSWAWI